MFNLCSGAEEMILVGPQSITWRAISHTKLGTTKVALGPSAEKFVVEETGLFLQQILFDAFPIGLNRNRQFKSQSIGPS
jgi:hypothetical protein